MRIGLVSEQLLSRAAFGGKPAFSAPAGGQGLAALAGRFAALRSGSQADDAPNFQPVFRFEARFRDVDRFETRDITETRDVMREEAVEEVRDVYATRDILEERTRYVSRAITQARVEGTRSLSGMNSTSAAGIASGSDFSVTTADGASVQVTFDNSRMLSVTSNGQTKKIRFDAQDGSFKQALVDGLNGAGGISAAWTADGRLALSDDSAITIAAVGGNSTLAALGLSAGVTHAEVVGTEQVADGTEMVVVGTEQYVTGTETVVVGTRQVKIGEEQAVTGTERVKVGTERVADGLERKLAGLERLAAAPSLWDPEGSPRKIPVSVVDVIADVVKFRDSLFSEAESRSAYDFAATLEKEDTPELIGTLRNEAERPGGRARD